MNDDGDDDDDNDDNDDDDDDDDDDDVGWCRPILAYNWLSLPMLSVNRYVVAFLCL